MKSKSIQTSLADLLIVVMIFAGCGGTSGGGGGGTSYTPVGSVSVTLPLLPIEIAYDFINDKVKVSISNKIQTPIGTFAISGGVLAEEKKYLAAERKFKGVRKLRIEAGTQMEIYRIEDGRPYSVNIPTDVNGQTRLENWGSEGDIRVIVPNPTPETVAQLKAEIAALQQRLNERAQITQEPEPAAVEAPSGGDPEPRGPAAPEPPSPTSDSYTQPAPRRSGGGGGVYKGSTGLAEVSASEAGGFSFRLSTPHCSREAVGRARWKSTGLAESVSPIREDAAGVEYATPVESTCQLTFTFSGGDLMVTKVGENCHCAYTGLYSLY